MPARTLPGLGLTGFWDLGFDGWKDENDINLRLASALIQARALSKESTTPGAPTNGDIYLFDETHATQANKVAIRDDGAWVYVTPLEGWLVYNIAMNYYEKFDGTVWAELATGGGGGPSDEYIQDLVAAMFIDTASVTWAYDDTSGELEATSAGGGGGGGGGLPMLFDLSKGVPEIADLTSLGNATYFVNTENPGIALNCKNIADVNDTGGYLGGWSLPVTGDFHHATLVLQNQYKLRYFGPSMGVRDSSTGRLHTFNIYSHASDGFGGIAEETWTNPDTRNSVVTEVTTRIPIPGSFIWLHLKRESGNLSFGVSMDGANPSWWFTGVDGDSWCATPDEVYFGFYAQGTDYIANQSATFLCYDDDADARVMGAPATAGGVATETLIQRVTTAASQASVTFATIAGTYDELRVKILGRSSRASNDNGAIVMQFNSDTGNNYDWGYRYAFGGSAGGATDASVSAGQIAWMPAATSQAGFPGMADITIPRYADTVWKKIAQSISTNGAGGGAPLVLQHAMNWDNTAAITDITLKPDGSDTWVDGSIVELIGVKYGTP